MRARHVELSSQQNSSAIYVTVRSTIFDPLSLSLSLSLVLFFSVSNLDDYLVRVKLNLLVCVPVQSTIHLNLSRSLSLFHSLLFSLTLSHSLLHSLSLSLILSHSHSLSLSHSPLVAMCVQCPLRSHDFPTIAVTNPRSMPAELQQSAY